MMQKNRESIIDLLRSMLKEIWNSLPSFAFLNIIFNFNLALATIATALLFLIRLGIAFLLWYNKIFYIKDNVLYYHTGIFNKKTLEIPLNLIMGVSIKENFSEKLFSLRTLILDRGLEEREEMNLTLQKDKAYNFRNLLLQKLSEDVSVQNQDENEIYKLSFLDLLFFSFFKRSYLQIIAFLFSSASFIVRNELGENFTIPIMPFLILIFVITLSLLLINFYINFTQLYGFTVYKKADFLEIHKGFLNRKISSVNIKKICSVTTHQGFTQRLTNKISVSVNTLGFKEDVGSAVIFPMLNKKLLDKTIKDLFPNFEFCGKIFKIHKKYRFRYNFSRYGFDDKLIYLYYGVFKKRSCLILTNEVDVIRYVQYPWNKPVNTCKIKINFKAMKLNDLKYMKGVPISHFNEISNIVLNK